MARPGKVAKPKHKPKRFDPNHGKNHRFESFTSRIARLNIDPLRRNASANVHRSLDGEKSHFRASFQEWCDLNMSEDFVAFRSEIDPLCQSLPQIVHHEDEIVDLVMRYLEKRNELSLEPLLALTSHLAYDLGVRFEKHFGRVVGAIADIAAKHSSIEVIEWSFACLAYLFKFLSRLLVPDLRPLFDLMAPFLGKTHQKHFITRFAAEAMSFLIKKAGAQYPKNKGPLQIIIQHAFQDLESIDTSQSELYAQGLAFLFAESVKGIQKGVNSSASSIVHCLLTHSLETTPRNPRPTITQKTVEYVLTNVIHETDAAGFEPILASAIEVLSANEITEDSYRISTAARLIVVLAGVRKGSRLSSWSPLLDIMVKLFQVLGEGPERTDIGSLPQPIQAAAVSLQYAPFNAIIGPLQTILELFKKPGIEQYYICFCISFERLGSERFNELILADFQEFIAKKWMSHAEELCWILPALCRAAGCSLSIPSSWIQTWVSTMSSIWKQQACPSRTGTIQPAALANRHFDLITLFPPREDFHRDFVGQVIDQLLKTPEEVQGENYNRQALIMLIGKGLLSWSNFASPRFLDPPIQRKILQASADLHLSPLYLQGIKAILDCLDISSDNKDASRFVELLTGNLASSSHEIRLLSLEILQRVQDEENQTPNESMQLALSIEQTPPTFENLRHIAMGVRKLAIVFDTQAKPHWMRQAIPMYCFGLCHIRLAPIWKDVAETLTQLCQIKEVEEIVAKQALTWIQTPTTASDMAMLEETEDDSATPPQRDSTTFQCTNLLALDHTFDQQAQDCAKAATKLQDIYNKETRIVPVNNSLNRSKALMLLSHCSQIAERRSRVFVPVFLGALSAVSSETPEPQTLGESESDIEEMTEPAGPGIFWDIKSKEAILEIFSKFVNPAVIFRTEEVYSSLLQALCNGDSGIQSKALKAVITWRPQVIPKYRENLFNLLDDARFREELTIFLNSNREEQSIELAHKQELMPVLLRLLYGRVVNRSGNQNARRLQGARRKAVLLSVARLGPSELREFVLIALGPLFDLDLQNNDNIGIDSLGEMHIGPRKTLGTMRLVRDILEAIPNHITPISAKLMDAIIYCHVSVSREQKLPHLQPNKDDDQTALTKATRHEALDCLTVLFDVCTDQDWMPYSNIIMEHIVRPRLPNLPIETAQGISVILRLFSVWCSNTNTLALPVLMEPAVLEKAAECLCVPSARDEVKIFILSEIFKKLFASAENLGRLESEQTQEIKKHLSENVAPRLVEAVAHLVPSTTNKDCLHACVQSLIALGDLVEESGKHTGLLKSSALLLKQPLKIVGPAIKADILRLLLRLVPAYDFTNDAELFADLWSTFSVMFSHLPSPSERTLLVSVIKELGATSSLAPISQICATLNALSEYRIGEPDYDRRLEALNSILSNEREPYNGQEWQPLLHNMIHLIKDNEELSMRSGASLVMQRFVDEATIHKTPSDVKLLLIDTLIPTLQRGMKEPSELIKAEYLTVLAKIIRADASPLADMLCLVGPDDESAFFSNVLHIQQHRRVRALKTLAREAKNISSANISRFCVPLLEMFTVEEEDTDLNLASEATNALGSLAEGLEWSAYRALAQRITSNADTYQNKRKIRALSVIVQALLNASKVRSSEITAEDGKTKSALSRSLPSRAAMQKAISQVMLPKIQEFIHYKDEATVDLRVMVAPVAIRLIMLFDADEISVRLPSILIDLCNILRSKAQEARDAARKTLGEIAAIIGADYFSFILKQLRSSLDRGSRLHVLSYTCHSLLTSVQPVFGLGHLDDCVPDIMEIVITDIFGSVGHEKDAEGYVSKMKEVRKKNLSYDTTELMASFTTVETTGSIFGPIIAQLDKPRPKMEKVDELLRRVREGFRRNEDAKRQQWLILCFQLIRDANGKADSNQQMTRPVAYKMAGFGWDLVRRILDKHESLKTAANLTGFLPMLSTSLSQNEEQVRAASMRFLTSIIKTPLDDIDANAGDYIKIIKRIIEHSSSTNTPLAQAALRLLAALLRERPYAIIKKSYFEDHIAYVLSRIRPDLTEPERSGEREKQVAAFNLLKAVLNRGVLIKEVYEVMETVREVMITSNEPPIPDLSRSVYSRFVIDYFPDEGKGFSKQLDFLISNLQYPSPNGRQSVMDVLNFVMSKKGVTAAQALLLETFLPLVLVMASDTSEKCRIAARGLLQKTFELATKDTKKSLRLQMQKWLDQSDDLLWKSIGFQCWDTFLAVNPEAHSDVTAVLAQVDHIIVTEAEQTHGDAHKALQCALELLKSLCASNPSAVFTHELRNTWSIIPTMSSSESATTRLVSAQLFTLFLSHFAKNMAARDQPAQIPLSSSSGLAFDTGDAVAAIETHSEILQSDSVIDDAIVDVVIGNLAFLGRLSAGGDSQAVFDSLLENVAQAVRHETPSGSPLRPKLAATRLLQSLCKQTSVQHIGSSISEILHALNNQTDKDIPKAASTNPDEASVQDEITTIAQETLDVLQSKLGSQAFVAQMQKVQGEVRKRREDRRAKRKIDAVAQPARAERIKHRKHELGKSKRREKNKLMAGRRRGW